MSGGKYEVSSFGRVRHVTLGRVVEGYIDSTGYRKVSMRMDGGVRQVRVHRLVAWAFLPNPDGLPVVRHLDDVKVNNVISNLHWGTHQDNSNDCVLNDSHANSGKTHCPQGHPYDEVNTYHTSGRRYCRRCRANAYQAKKAA